MSNMSYCRFENTERDLMECIDAASEREISSDYEKRAFLRMCKVMANFLIRENLINEECEYDEERAKEIIKECEES